MSTRAAAAEATRDRIVAAAVAAFASRWYEDVTVRGVAADAGVALQTVRNHFVSKEELFSAAAERIHAQISTAREDLEPGDVAGAIATLVDDYERTGEMNLRMLAVEDRVPVVQPVMARGRDAHEAWVKRAFAGALTGLRGATRTRRIAQLVVATDVYAWKLLRRDKGLSREQTVEAMSELVAALTHHDSHYGKDPK